MAEWAEFIPATGREVLRPHIGVDHEHLLGSTGRQHSKPQTRREHRVSKKLQPPYEFVVESLPPITGHAANSRNDSRPFITAFGLFLFSSTTLCAFVSPPFSPCSVTHT